MHGIVHRDIKIFYFVHLILPMSPSSTLAWLENSLQLMLGQNTVTIQSRVIETLSVLCIGAALTHILATVCAVLLHFELGLTEISDLRPYDDLESLAYTLLYLLMGDLPWRIFAPRESTKNAIVRILAAKQAFTGSTIPSVVPVEFRDMLDFARNAKGDITGDLAEMRMKMHTLASNLDEVENKSLDFTPEGALFPREDLESGGGSESDSDETSDEEPNEEYSNSYWGMDIDCWDMRAARDKSLTFPTAEAELLDGQIPEMAVIDRFLRWQ
jgi:hypothetical protein